MRLSFGAFSAFDFYGDFFLGLFFKTHYEELLQVKTTEKKCSTITRSAAVKFGLEINEKQFFLTFLK